MTKPLLIITLILGAGIAGHAQYYYKDILTKKDLVAEMARMKEQKVRSVSLKSFESDGSPSEGFFCEKKISRNYSSAETMSRSDITGISSFTASFNSKGQLLQTVDSSNISSSTSVFTYTADGQIQSIASSLRSSDDDFQNEITEAHYYEYNDKGVPVKMIKVKNNTDSTLFVFSTDENNNVGIEKNTTTGDAYYYYYDSKKRITDVVRLNTQSQKMLPDYIFEYNYGGLITQMTSIEDGSSNYFIWKYTYENGLRVKEKCFSKEKRLLGSIEYEYN
ncbi:MAG: hypothetical protein WCI49_10850 [Ferruginibacter sp.]